MRKLIALLLTLSMAASLMGCSQEDAASGETAGVASGETTASETAVAAQGTVPSLGTIDGNTYTSTYLELGCTLGEGWVFYSADQLQELPEGIQSQPDSAASWEKLKDDTQIFDMKAESAEDMASVNILLMKASVQERVAYALLSEQEVLDAVLEQKDDMISSYTEAGFTVDSMEAVTVTFLGQERVALRTVASLEGVPYYVLQVFDYSLGQMSMILTASCFMEDNTESLIETFYAL